MGEDVPGKGLISETLFSLPAPPQVSKGPTFLRNVPVSFAHFFVSRQSSPVGVGEVRPAGYRALET